MKKAFLIFFLLSVQFAIGQEAWYPLGQNEKVTKHTYYSLSYSEAHEQSEWVQYTINSGYLNSSISRTNNFREDPLISTTSAQLVDYKGSGFDRGHLAPAADMKYNHSSMSESFYMSNMSPQAPGFNRQIWRLIEQQFREWASEYGELVIVTGPVLNGDYLGTIGPSRVTVPRYYYKVALDPDNYERNIAILIENKASSEPIRSFAVSIDSLERFTGIDFFYKIDDEVEEKIEGEKALGYWNWTGHYTPTPRYNYGFSGPNQVQPSIETIFRTNTGKRYHRSNCRSLSRSKIPITLKEAQNRGLSPCGVCRP